MKDYVIRTSLWKIPLLLSIILFHALYVECFVSLRQEKSTISYNYISNQLFASAVSSESTVAPGKPSPRDQKARRKTRILFQSAKQLEKQGKWREASDMYQQILQEDPRDSHSHLGYARLEARRDSKSFSSNSTARHAFLQGTILCPDSVHLWQAWALYEQSCGDYDRARALLEQALTLDERNPYVCHAYGLMEKKLGNQHVSDEKEILIKAVSR
jgi:tetratricopeptide (TPR) repeat protein